MLNDFPGADKVYIACGYTDLRKGIDGHFEPVDEDIEWRIEFSVDEPLKETFQLV